MVHLIPIDLIDSMDSMDSSGSVYSIDPIDSIDFNWAQLGPGVGPNWAQFLVPIGLILVFTLLDGQCENKGVWGFGSRQA